MRYKKPYFIQGIAVPILLGAVLVLSGCGSSATVNPPPASTPAATTPAQTAPIAAGTVTIDLTCQSFSFDKSAMSVPAGATVTINFVNKDTVPHNFALYNDSSASQTIFKGQIITKPGSAIYTFTAPTKPGIYFFRCDLHPGSMKGNFIVQ